MPMYVLPDIDFSTQTPYVSATEWSSSASKVKGSAVLVAELLVRVDRVGADPQHDRPAALELAPGVADRTRLHRAAGRVVLGIEVENDGLAAERR